MAQPASPLPFPERDHGQSWPVQGQWTYTDYLRLPDDGRRYEVIRGTLYVSPAPTYEHQFTVSSLCWLFTAFVRQSDLGVVLVAPFDVLLPQRIADPVQPDLVVFKKDNGPRRGDKNFSGVPDLVVEVLSPTTRRLDEKIKLAAYRDAGIPEVWFADPQPRRLSVFHLDQGAYVEVARGGPGGTIGSTVLPGLQVAVDQVFP